MICNKFSKKISQPFFMEVWYKHHFNEAMDEFPKRKLGEDSRKTWNSSTLKMSKIKDLCDPKLISDFIHPLIK